MKGPLKLLLEEHNAESQKRTRGKLGEDRSDAEKLELEREEEQWACNKKINKQKSFDSDACLTSQGSRALELSLFGFPIYKTGKILSYLLPGAFEY